MLISGKIIKLGDNLAGTTKDGKSYVKKTVVIETTDTNPKKIAFEAFGDRIVGNCVSTLTADGQPYYYKNGDLVLVNFAPRSREHDGRWFTELSIFDMSLLQAAIV